LLQLAHTRRPRRAGDWTEAKAVTFIVTLAASRSVTLASARAGMSRKAAYALKRRDPGFALAWNAAVGTAAAAERQEPALNPIQGDKVDETHNPRSARRQGVMPRNPFGLSVDTQLRDIFFGTLRESARESRGSSLARARTLP
jgi:hypothetical protein